MADALRGSRNVRDFEDMDIEAADPWHERRQGGSSFRSHPGGYASPIDGGARWGLNGILGWVI